MKNDKNYKMLSILLFLVGLFMIYSSVSHYYHCHYKGFLCIVMKSNTEMVVEIFIGFILMIGGYKMWR